ncbi:MAG: PAS domain-containing protein [Massilia sp.]|nr:PAS domain-containing protein [Massilia sp.]
MNYNWRWVKVIFPLLATVAVLLGLSAFSMDILSSTRAFVEGESLYSKEQKNALLHLMHYVDSHEESDYQEFLRAIAVPLGDRDARVALDQAKPDIEAARQGFLTALNHPDDIDGMIRLFRNFRHIHFMSDVIATWAEGDRYIHELTALASRLHAAIHSGRYDDAALRASLTQIKLINARITPLEKQFSAKLGDASRKTKNLLLMATLAIALALIAVGCVISRAIFKVNEKFEKSLMISEERLNFAMRGISDGLWEWDIAAKSIYYSPRMKELLEEHDEQVFYAEDYFYKFIHPRDIHLMRANIDQFKRGKSFDDAEFRIITRSGRLRWLHSRAYCVLDAAGNRMRLVGSISDITDRKQAEEKLRHSQFMLRNLAAHQETVREDERKRIARDIHDDLGQNLMVLRIDVSMIAAAADSGAVTQQRIAATLHQIDTTIKSVRAIINDLRPSVLDLGLHAAIEWLAGEFEQRNGIVCDLHIDHAEFELGDKNTTVLFRIVQESLNNIVRHAQASHVVINMQRQGQELILSIADDGIGLPHDRIRKKDAFGLAGIEERIFALGGKFSATSNPGQGMAISVSIPLPCQPSGRSQSVASPAYQAT